VDAADPIAATFPSHFVWVGLKIGRQRGNFIGTFGVSVDSALDAESLHPLSRT
jgi:hypothetical protein